MKRVTEEAFRRKQWTRWLKTLDYGPTVVQFRTARDMASAKTVAARFSGGEEPYTFTVMLEASENIGTFVKIPRDAGTRKMTRGDAVRLSAMRMMPSEAMTDEYIKAFDTVTAKEKARAIRKLMLFERLAERLFRADNLRRKYERRTDNDKDDETVGDH